MKVCSLKKSSHISVEAHNSHNLNMTHAKTFKTHNGNHEERVIKLMRETAKKREDELRKQDHDGSYVHFDSDDDGCSSGPIFEGLDDEHDICTDA